MGKKFEQKETEEDEEEGIFTQSRKGAKVEEEQVHIT